jgi:hypothetical protein
MVVRLAKLIESHLAELDSATVEELEESGVKSLTPTAPAPAPAPAPGGASPPATPPTENPQQ